MQRVALLLRGGRAALLGLLLRLLLLLCLLWGGALCPLQLPVALQQSGNVLLLSLPGERFLLPLLY